MREPGRSPARVDRQSRAVCRGHPQTPAGAGPEALRSSSERGWPPREGRRQPGASPLPGLRCGGSGTRRRARVAEGRFEAGTARRGAGMRELPPGPGMESDILDALEALG